MNEIKHEAEKITEKIPWQTRWAKKAFIYSLVAWGLLGVSVFASEGIVIILPASFIFGVVSFIISLVVLVSILHKKGSVKGAAKAAVGLLCSLLFIMVFWMFTYAITNSRFVSGKVACKNHLIGLKNALNIYSNQYGQYPPAENWCDLLMQNPHLRGYFFACPAAREEHYHQTIDQDADPNSPWFQIFSYRDPNGKVSYVKRCHYAINPNCKPNSPNDIVLLFETKGGWNQFGGVDILTTAYHMGRGCSVLFNDGQVEFIKPDQIGQLKWKAE
jgi:hypothetical protein